MRYIPRIEVLTLFLFGDEMDTQVPLQVAGEAVAADKDEEPTMDD